ncbi:MAG TPA: 3-hydroxydecanoyl-ACP dehydratase [Psychromonas hadalis]|nr:3-hydroxydecanoyl-ACP dehydratase [Psychromonas hadalis]
MSDFPNIETLLPHEAPMTLIDKMLAVEELSVHCQVTITTKSPFFDENEQGVGGWVGLEYMAQTIAAWSGYHNIQKGKASQIGFLLGNRRYDSQLPIFPIGMTLDIFATLLLENDGMAAFACEIQSDDKVLASSQLNVFLPAKEQVEAMLKGKKDE